MAIARMAKVMIVSYCMEASDLLEALQREGICQILNADEAMVSKDMPELRIAAEQPRDIEDLLNRLQKSMAFLKSYAEPRKGLASVLSPRVIVDEQSYNKVTSDEQILKIVDESERVAASIEKARSECETLQAALDELRPWQPLQTPVEEIGQFARTICQAGLLPTGQLRHVQENIGELGGAIPDPGHVIPDEVRNDMPRIRNCPAHSAVRCPAECRGQSPVTHWFFNNSTCLLRYAG